MTGLSGADADAATEAALLAVLCASVLPVADGCAVVLAAAAPAAVASFGDGDGDGDDRDGVGVGFAMPAGSSSATGEAPGAINGEAAGRARGFNSVAIWKRSKLGWLPRVVCARWEAFCNNFDCSNNSIIFDADAASPINCTSRTAGPDLLVSVLISSV